MGIVTRYRHNSNNLLGCVLLFNTLRLLLINFNGYEVMVV